MAQALRLKGELVYEWVEPTLENRLLHTMTTMEIVIEAEP
jgi:hypothetical protein